MCCSLKKSHKAGILTGKGCLELSHLGSWSLAAAVKPHPRRSSTWDRLYLGISYPGISYPSAPLSWEARGGQSREWGWTQNRARSREIGHPTRKLRYGNNASHQAAVLRQDLAKPPKLYPAGWKVLGCPLDRVTQMPCPDELMGLLQALILKSQRPC